MSPNTESGVLEGGVNENVPVTNKVPPPEKKRKVEHYQKPMVSKSKQTWEETSTIDNSKKSVNTVEQVIKLLYKPEEDDSEMYFWKKCDRPVKTSNFKKNPD